MFFRFRFMMGVLWGLILSMQVLGTSEQAVLAAEPLVEVDHTIQTFLVSAYYSPLPDQEAYVKGSYEADIVLNGRGLKGADGTDVYYGMLAAPKSYAFGTKIYLPGLGVGTVHDRGGAIVERTNDHRIDVWMGFGDEGRIRAMQWGMRKINGLVYDENVILEDSLFDGINDISDPITILSHPLGLGLSKSLASGDNDAEVRNLQKALQELGLYAGPITGFFGPQTQIAVKNFQYTVGIIDYHNDSEAGKFGPYTKELLEKKWQEKKIKEMASAITPSKLVFEDNMGFGDKGYQVERLQMILRDLGYFNFEVTGNFGYQTLSAVQQFQKDQDLIAKSTDFGAGHFGPQTRTKLETILGKRRMKYEDAEKNIMKTLQLNLSQVVEDDTHISS